MTDASSSSSGASGPSAGPPPYLSDADAQLARLPSASALAAAGVSPASMTALASIIRWADGALSIGEPSRLDAAPFVGESSFAAVSIARIMAWQDTFHGIVALDLVTPMQLVAAGEAPQIVATALLRSFLAAVVANGAGPVALSLAEVDAGVSPHLRFSPRRAAGPAAPAPAAAAAAPLPAPLPPSLQAAAAAPGVESAASVPIIGEPATKRARVEEVGISGCLRG